MICILARLIVIQQIRTKHQRQPFFLRNQKKMLFMLTNLFLADACTSIQQEVVTFPLLCVDH